MGIFREIRDAAFGAPKPKGEEKKGFAKADFSGEKEPNTNTPTQRRSVLSSIFGPLPKNDKNEKDSTLFKGGKTIGRKELERQLEKRKYEIWGGLHKYEKELSSSDIKKKGEEWFDPKKYGRYYIDKDKVKEKRKELVKEMYKASGKEQFSKKAELEEFDKLFFNPDDRKN